MPKVSVVVPTYERPKLLTRALDSVSAQSFERFECIVVDDGSMADLADVVAQYDNRFRYLRHSENRGASAARNTGIEQSVGDYIAFLDDDDIWKPTKLQKQVDVLDNAPATVGLVYCWMDYYDEDGSVVRRHHPTLDGYVLPEVLDRQRIGGCPTLLVRRVVVETVGGFDESLPRGNDGDFIRRVAQNHLVEYVPETLVNVDWGHGRDRISQLDESGIRNAIHGHEVKFEKFGSELEQYPDRAARIHARIAHHHGKLGEWRNSLGHYRRAIETSPTTPQVYRFMLSSVKNTLLE